MHIGRQIGRHTTIGRSLANDEDIEARDPSLINLPIPLPSIPILDPLLSPLIGGSQPTTTKAAGTTATTAPASSAPAPTTTSSSGSSGGGTPTGGGTSTGSGSSGSGSGDTGSSGSGTGSTGDTGSSGSTSGSTGSGGTDTSGDGSSSQPSGVSSVDPSSPSATQSQSDPASPSGTAASGSTGSGNNLASSGNLGNTDSSSSSSSGGSGDGTSGTANAGPIPDNGSGDSSSNGSSSASPSTGSNGLPVSTATGGSGTTSSTGTTSGTNTVEGSSKSGTSPGVIVAIVLVLLLFLAVLALGIRRRQRARRNDRANKWWFTGKRTSQTYADNRNSAEIMVPSGGRSARSSFATTVDHSNTPHNASFLIPPLPPMAEVGRDDGRAPPLVIDVSQFGGAKDPRFSIGSQGSSDSQFLVVTHRDSMTTEMAGTPTSVRPFSPSESFAFPRPPDPVGDLSSTYSRPTSIATVSNKSSTTTSPHASYGEIIPPIPPAPTFPAPIPVLISPNLFGADPVPVANPFADNNPFEDVPSTPTPASTSFPVPVPVFPPPVAGAFADVEYIKRPFNPSLADELQVTPDDGVRVLQTFDDGWALVEKVSSADGKGKGNAHHGNLGKGLIPIDCLREPGQTLPSFFAVKRVSNYAESAHTVSSESPFAFSAF